MPYGSTGARRRAAASSQLKPVNSVLPAITGTLTVGSTLTTTNGTWSKSPAFARQWLRAGQPIAGATGLTYTLAAGDQGKAISVRVTATSQGFTESATSAATAAIA